MVLFSEFVAWQNFAATEFAQSEVAEARAEAAQRNIEAQMTVQNWGTKDTATQVKAKMAIDPSVEQARHDVLTAYAQRKMTSTIYANCERCANVISRELSRRIGRDTTERRSMRWNP